MKKIINTLLACGFMVAVCAMFPSCLVLVDDGSWGDWEVTVEQSVPEYARVAVENTCVKYGSDAAYIQQVSYRSYKSDEWKVIWDCGEKNPLYADNYCNFKLDEGNYYFSVRVVYPNMSKQYNYYDDYDTSVRYFCADGSTLKLLFDGDNLYRK